MAGFYLSCVFATSSHAQVATDWTCLSGVTDWTKTACWSALAGADTYPDDGSSSYQVRLPTSGANPNGNYAVILNAGADSAIAIDSLEMPGPATRLDVGAGRSFTVLTSMFTRGTLISSGSFGVGPGATVDVDATGLSAAGGGVLALPITSYTDMAGLASRHLRADGAGSVLELPGLTQIFGNPSVIANTGGKVDLPALMTLDTPAFTAQGPGSVLNIPQVTVLPQGSRMAVVDRAKVFAAPLTRLEGAALFLNGASTNGGGAGANLDLSQVVDVDRSSVIVESGATAALPLLTAFTGANNAGFVTNGSGCVLDLSSLVSMTSTNLGILLHANNGGSTLAPNLASTSGSVNLQCVGAGSVLRVDGLASMAPGGSIRVGSGGRIVGAPFLDLSRISLRVDGPSVAGPDDYVGLFDTRFVTRLDSPSVDVALGAKIAFPALASIASGFGLNHIVASGAGSRIELPALASVISSAETLILRAQSAGSSVSAPALTAMSGPVQLLADGSGSVLELGCVDLGPSGYVETNLGGEIRVHGSFAFRMTDPTRFRWLGGASLSLLGGIPADCEELEVAGEDRGDMAAGWTTNFQLDRLVIGPGARIELVDALDNGNRGGVGGDPEALYVETLVFADPAGVLETNGIHLYYHSLVGDPAQVTTRARCCVAETTAPFMVPVTPLTARLLEICPPPGRSIIIGTSSVSRHSLKARWGEAPTSGEFDEFAGSRRPSIDTGRFENRLLLSATREQSLSVLLEGEADVEVSIEFRDFALAEAAPRVLSSGKTQILALRGDDLDRLAALRIIDSTGAAVEASEIRGVSPQRAEAMVTPVGTGPHDVVAVSVDDLESRLDDWIEVVDESFPILTVDLVGPDKVRASSDWAGYSLIIENLGCEVPAPLLRIEGHCPEDRIGLPGEEDLAGPVLHVFAPGASLSRLGPAERREVPILYRPGCCASALCGIERAANGEVIRDDRLVLRCSIYVSQADDLIGHVEGIPERLRRALPARWRDLYQQVLPLQAVENAHRGLSPFSVAAAYREFARHALGLGSGALTGQVTESLTEIPIAGAVVLALLEDRVIASATADPRGSWAIPCLGDGDYRIEVLDHELDSLRGGSPLERIAVRDGETVPNVNATASGLPVPEEIDVPEPGAQCEDPISVFPVPVPPGRYWEAARKRVIVGRSSDPNDKEGPTGEGEEQLVGRGDVLHYTIHCENLPGAGFPAYKVVVEDRLDPGVFDLSSFHFHDIQIAGRTLQRADVLHESEDFFSGYSAFDRQDSYAFDAQAPVKILDPSGTVIDELVVDIRTSFDTATAVARWEIVDSRGIGFLVPEDTLHQGQLAVTFSVQAKPDLDPSICNEILNRASITFDENEPLITLAWRNSAGTSCAVLQSTVASTPRPPDGETGVSWLDVVLAWRASYAESVDVYLGTAPEALVLLESANGSSYHALPSLEPGTRYFWQVVPLAAGDTGCAPGGCPVGCCPVWSFTTASSASSADPAENPSPRDGASGVDLLPRLSWSSGNALAYSVHLWPAADERPANPIAAATPSNELLLEEPLLPGTTYLWTVLALGSVPEQDSPGPVWSFTTAGGMSMRRGDANADGSTDLSDAITTLGYLFLGSAPLSCLDAGDADDSGDLNITDAIYLLGHLFLGGPAPPAPGIDECGADPTDDGLSCDAQPRCP